MGGAEGGVLPDSGYRGGGDSRGSGENSSFGGRGGSSGWVEYESGNRANSGQPVGQLLAPTPDLLNTEKFWDHGLAQKVRVVVQFPGP